MSLPIQSQGTPCSFCILSSQTCCASAQVSSSTATTSSSLICLQKEANIPEFSCHFPSSFAPFSGSLVHGLQDFLSLLPKCQHCSCIYAQVEHQPNIPSRMHLLSILEKCSPSAKLIRCIQKAINHQLADKHYLLLRQLPQKVTASSLGRHKIPHLSHILVILTNLHYSNDCTQTTCFRASSICLLNPGRDYLPQ